MPAQDYVSVAEGNHTSRILRPSQNRTWRIVGATAASLALAGLAVVSWRHGGKLDRAAVASGDLQEKYGHSTDAMQLLLQSRVVANIGGCELGVDCHRVNCCKAIGFKCIPIIPKTEWWYGCVVDPELYMPPQPNCSWPGWDCTQTKCCSNANHECKSNGGDAWFTSTCVAKNETEWEELKNSEKGDACNVINPKGEVSTTWSRAYTCADKLVEKMSREDKLEMLHGNQDGLGYSGSLRVNNVVGRKGIPMRLNFNDGPQGYNGYANPMAGNSTQFPNLISVAATFNTKMAGQYGEAVAGEFRRKGAGAMLGPVLQVTRSQLSGRVSESISGEDPHLGSVLAKPFVKAVQGSGVIAVAKHWLDSNQETDRGILDVKISNRAQQEVYIKPFKAAIEAGAGGVMCAYNKVNGEQICENRELLQDLLRDELGFKGFVVSEWGAAQNGLKSMEAGMNIEMPQGQYSSEVAEGAPDKLVDERAKQVLAAMYAAGQFHGHGPQVPAEDWTWPPPYYKDTTSDHADRVAEEVIEESTVLLKNDGVLPIKVHPLMKIAMVGEACHAQKDPQHKKKPLYSSSSSGYVATTNDKVITPYEGLAAKLHGKAHVTWAPHTLMAFGADVVIVCNAAHAEEGKDRENLHLPHAKDLVETLKKQAGEGKKQKIISVMFVPGAVHTDFVEDVDAALVMWMPGQQVGFALANMLMGDSVPSGRLPVSFPKSDEDRFTKEQFPGVNGTVDYSEETLVGYKWNDAKGIPSAYPFGYGMTYSKMEIKDLAVHCTATGAQATFKIKNTGAMADYAVPQLYLSYPSLAPVQRALRGFKKVKVEPGHEVFEKIQLDRTDWAYFDSAALQWNSALANKEEITVHLGSSSTDLPLTAKITCSEQPPRWFH